MAPGLVTKHSLCLANVGAGVRNVTGLVGTLLDLGGLAYVLLDDADELVEATCRYPCPG